MNDMTISQAATILGSVVEQATGQKVITDITTPEVCFGRPDRT